LTGGGGHGGKLSFYNGRKEEGTGIVVRFSIPKREVLAQKEFVKNRKREGVAAPNFNGRGEREKENIH